MWGGAAHYNKEHYHVTIHEIERRQFVIRSFGYRGYSVNRDLERALDAEKNDWRCRGYFCREDNRTG